MDHCQSPDTSIEIQKDCLNNYCIVALFHTPNDNTGTLKKKKKQKKLLSVHTGITFCNYGEWKRLYFDWHHCCQKMNDALRVIELSGHNELKRGNCGYLLLHVYNKVEVLINVFSVETEHSSLFKPGGATACIRLMKMKYWNDLNDGRMHLSLWSRPS